MSNFFNYDNKVMSALTRITDAVVLGILWLVCSIPVFTVGAASTAFYYAFNKAVRQRRGYAWQEFFAGFKANFKQATKIWLLVLGLTLVALADCYILSVLGETMAFASILTVIILSIIVVTIVWGLYLFPYIARFENNTRAVMKNCGLIALANLPWSVLLLLTYAIAVVVFVLIPFLSIFIPTIYMFVANRILERVFKKYMTPEDLEAQKELDKNER